MSLLGLVRNIREIEYRLHQSLEVKLGEYAIRAKPQQLYFRWVLCAVAGWASTKSGGDGTQFQSTDKYFHRR